MSSQIAELESILQQLVAEHGRLIDSLGAQQDAMKRFSIDEVDSISQLQEVSRRKIALLDRRRQGILEQLSRQHKVAAPINLSRLIQMYPQRAASLQQLQADLREVGARLRARSHVAGRLAGAVLGHLNTVVRLLSGAVERAGLYGRNGTPTVSGRIGVMEAIG